ncbi:MAG TPA: serine/threonine-protein kinase [Micromonosporaceae bacterium]|nr:serine/threonine-protein kinase [Micromonosporaceae bacterium]
MSPTPPVIKDYRPERLLGEGGFADVYLYRQEGAELRVAIKVLRADTAHLRRLFQGEARALGRLADAGQHPHIVPVHRYSGAGERPYIVMEYCPQGSLADRVRNGARLSPSEVIRIGIQLAGALQTAHLAHVVHRDIKPGNVLLAADHEPKLGDFGIAAVTAHAIAAPPDWLSPHYAAPEVGAGTADERADLYALAATLYELLAGRPPFRLAGGDNSSEAVQDRARRLPVPPIGRPDLPPDLERHLTVAMTKDPRVRARAFSSMKDFADALAGIELAARYSPTRIKILSPAPEDPPRDVPPTIREPGSSTGEVPVDPADDAGRTGWVPGPSLVADTEKRGQVHPVSAPGSAPVRGHRRWLPLGVAGLVAAAVTGVAIASVASGGTGVQAPGSTGTGGAPGQDQAAVPGMDGPVPQPSVTAERLADGRIRFRWAYQPTAAGDFFQVRRTDTASAAPPRNVRVPEQVLTTVDGPRPCIEVVVVRANGRASLPGRACAP